jgi:uncharacterized protein YcbK (DUF882 family)
VVAGTHNRVLPPQEMWDRLIPAMRFANELRRRMVERHGARGLRIAAAYRPTGGATNSQHKHNRALDLDLLTSDYGLTNKYYAEAVQLFREYTGPIGLGTYCRPTAMGGIRIHVDVGHKRRSWNIYGGKTTSSPSHVVRNTP